MKYLIIPAALEESVRLLETGPDGAGLEALQALVGGYLESIEFPALDVAGYVNKEGKTLGLPVNERATRLWRQAWQGEREVIDYLCGNVIIFAGVDEEGDERGLSEVQLADLHERIAKMEA